LHDSAGGVQLGAHTLAQSRVPLEPQLVVQLEPLAQLVSQPSSARVLQSPRPA
jgi:hypothetical protein